MIVTKNIEIKVNNKQLFNLRERGYNVSSGDTLLIKVEDLSAGSSIKIDVKCDVCNDLFITTNKIYKRYNGLIPIEDEFIKCKKCKSKKTCIEKWGVDNPNKSEEVRNKSKKTCIEKWGVDSPLKSKEILNKIKETNLERWGVEHPSKNIDIRNKISLSNLKTREIRGVEIAKKIKETNLERWGVEHPSKNREIYDKIKKTNLEKYGFECNFSSPLIQEKTKETNLNKFGFDHPSKSDIVKENKRLTFQNKFGFDTYSQTIEYKERIRLSNIEKSKELYKTHNCEVIDYKDNIYTIRSVKCEHSFETTSSLFYQRTTKNYEFCTICLPVSKMDSIGENMIYDFLISNNINVIKNCRNLISPKEIDLYLPDYKIGIEFNGLYWHSEIFKNNKYHFDKTINALFKNIRIVNIWEDEWIYKRDIVESILLNRLGLIDNKIGARLCKISIITNKIAKEFYDNNHIQGGVNSKYNIGLYFKDDLVSVMSFTNRNINSKKEFELTRFCNKKGFLINGSASKIFSFFLKNYDIGKIYTYSDNSMFSGDIYKNLGFSETSFPTINYWWFKGDRRYHRFNFNKKKLIKDGYDPNKTEVEIMKERGFLRIFGSGHKKWIWLRN